MFTSHFHVMESTYNINSSRMAINIPLGTAKIVCGNIEQSNLVFLLVNYISCMSLDV